MDRYDLITIGGGSAAFASAIRARILGKRVAIIEGELIGGTCVNRGCIPTKNLIEASKYAAYPKKNPFREGINISLSKIDWNGLREQKDRLVEQLRREKYTELLSLYDIDFYYGKGRFLESQVVDVDGKKLYGKRILIATGSISSIPNIKGLERVPFLVSKTLLEIESPPSHLLILGGSTSGLEFAQIFRRLGSGVDVIEVLPRILPFTEPEISKELQKILEEEGINFYTNEEVKEVQRVKDGVQLILSSGKILKGSHLLITTGMHSNTEELDIERVGVETKDGFIITDERMKTTNNIIYAAGDVVGPPMLLPVAAKEAIVATENMFGRLIHMNYRVIPWTVFTDPEVSGVGFTEREARDEGFDVESRIIPMKYVPRALAMRDTKGLIKMVVNKRNGEILGVHILAPHSGEFIHEAALAIKLRITLSELVDLIHVYPTLSESLKLVAQSFTRDPKTLSCCAE
jgi:mercuric reductase